MGNKYTVRAGCGNKIEYYFGTEWLFIALFKLWRVKIDKEKIFWKQVQVN